MYEKGTSRSFLVTSTQYCGLSTLQHSLQKKMFPPAWTSVGLLATLASADFYVSLNGSDTAAGTAHTPFRSFERAQKAVRGVVDNTNDDVRVYVAPGTYYLDESLLFTDLDSGQHGHKVIWEAQDMDKGVNISGGCEYLFFFVSKDERSGLTTRLQHSNHQLDTHRHWQRHLFCSSAAWTQDSPFLRRSETRPTSSSRSQSNLARQQHRRLLDRG
jgi:hypothetical protein